MDVHAGPTELPEWQECVASFEVRFRRPEGRAALERYTTGLLTEVPNKNCDTLAQAVPGTSEQRLQEFLTNMPWDEEDLNRQRVQKMVAEATRGPGVLVVDDTGLPKQGQASVGVARQYSGTLGKVGNCQIAVTCCYSDAQATWPVAGRLYRPQSWAEDPERRRRARVPAEIEFRTKPEMALALRAQARAWEVPHRGGVADADEGDNPNVLAGLEARQERYGVAVRTDFAVQLRSAAASRRWRADELLHTVPRWPWRSIRWRRGTKGWRRKQCVAVRCWRVAGEGQRHEGWWLGERATRGQPEARQDFWSNLPAETSLEELASVAHRRQAIEPVHEEAQGELGWDQDQGRLWSGFHRPAVTVMLASSVLVWVELRERHRLTRQGRPRAAFSPSAHAPAPVPASRPSSGGVLAPAPGRGLVGDNRSVHGPLLTTFLTK